MVRDNAARRFKRKGRKGKKVLKEHFHAYPGERIADVYLRLDRLAGLSPRPTPRTEAPNAVVNVRELWARQLGVAIHDIIEDKMAG